MTQITIGRAKVYWKTSQNCLFYFISFPVILSISFFFFFLFLFVLSISQSVIMFSVRRSHFSCRRCRQWTNRKYTTWLRSLHIDRLLVNTHRKGVCICGLVCRQYHSFRQDCFACLSCILFWHCKRKYELKTTRNTNTFSDGMLLSSKRNVHHFVFIVAWKKISKSQKRKAIETKNGK